MHFLTIQVINGKFFIFIGCVFRKITQLRGKSRNLHDLAALQELLGIEIEPKFNKKLFRLFPNVEYDLRLNEMKVNLRIQQTYPIDLEVIL